MVKQLKGIMISKEVYEWLVDLKFKTKSRGIDEVLRRLKNGEKIL